MQSGYKYAYIIWPGGHTGSKQLKPGRVSITAADPYAPPSPAEFSGQAGDSVATLVWNQAVTAEHYACYDVYGAKNNGLFQRVNAEPVLPTEPQDNTNIKICTVIGPNDRVISLYLDLTNIPKHICGMQDF